MSVWARKRQLTFLSILIFLLVLLVWSLYIFVFKKEDTCFDGLKNQTEINIDCGGGCAKVCTEETVEPVVLWSRAFRVDEGLYNVAAFVENPNLFGAEKIEYKFRLEDEFGRFMTERLGETYMNADQRFVVFEANIPVGKRVPRRTSFEIISKTPWHRLTEKERKVPVASFKFEDKIFVREDGGVKATATIYNVSIVDAKNVAVVAVMFDKDNNAIASSKTLVENLASEEKTKLTFTWPEDFFNQIVRFELYPRVYSVTLDD